MIASFQVKKILATFTILSLSILWPPRSSGQNADEVAPLFQKFSWRAIGPALMGGRTVDIGAGATQPWVIYAAVGPSGVWKSENAGITWYPVFYRETTVSVGDVTVAPSDPNIIWVGTGESTCRNSVTIGDGVYKSVDAGRSWKNMGLKETRHISRIVIHPANPNIVYVAAMGHLWGPNSERGLYKSEDGGTTWRKILFVNDDTGIADLAMDPEDPLILYAAAYEHRRLPYLYRSGGPGSGLYRTKDGGMTWKRLENGLPKGIMGRIGLAVSPSRPEVVYALIEHEDGGLWRSEDKGETWQRCCDRETYRRVNTRPFYFSQVRVDPTDDKVVYVLSTGAHVSTDGGRTFRAFGTGTHLDHHALWINPNNPRHLILGNDGGIDISYDGGRTWWPVQNIDAAEVYTIGYDFRQPYYVYCGLQDNGTWAGPSQTADLVGIANDDWVMLGGGDGMYVQVPPDDPLTVYANYQMNNLYRFDWRLRKSKNIRPLALLKEPPYRFNWLTPIQVSLHNTKTIYVGSQYLLRSSDGGQSWEKISPDLTTNDPRKLVDSGGPISKENTGAEIHCTITTISESPLAAGVIWCGTDDGQLWVTKDAGKTWNNVSKNIPDLPPNTWVSRVEASHFDPAVAYVAFDGHRNDDYNPYIYQTADYGQTWKSLRANLPFGWVHVVREDLKNANLLYAGTEFGIFASLDRGESWFSLKNNLPTVAVHDIAIHPRDNDLIIGTHGRGIWILDDISFLQEMNPHLLTKTVHIFKPRPVTAYYLSSRRESFTPPTFVAKNPPYGLGITIYFREKPKEKPRVAFLNREGEVVAEFLLPAQPGLQREYWNLQIVPKNKEGKRVSPPLTVAMTLPLMPPGEYKVELTVDGQTFEEKAVVVSDPRVPYDPVADQARFDLLAEVISFGHHLNQAITAVRQVRRELEEVKKQAEKESAAPDVRKKIEAFDAKLKGLERKVLPPSMTAYSLSREEALRGGGISSLILNLASSISGYPGAPTKTDETQAAEIGRAVAELIKAVNEFNQIEVPALNSFLKTKKLKTIKIPEEIKY